MQNGFWMWLEVEMLGWVVWGGNTSNADSDTDDKTAKIYNLYINIKKKKKTDLVFWIFFPHGQSDLYVYFLMHFVNVL